MQTVPPASPSPRLAAVLRALDANDTLHAVQLADEALAAGEEHPLFLNLSAFALERDGQLEAALARLDRALQLAPDDVLVLTAAGNTLSKLGRAPHALPFFDAALARHPAHAPAHHGRGLALNMIGQTDEARHSHMRAADLDPNYPDPLGALADHAMSSDRPEAARTLAERALSLQADQPSAALVMAALEAKAGEHAQAIARIERLLASPLTPLHRAAAEQLLGEAFDATDRPVEAFGAFVRANALVRRVNAPLYEAAEVETAVPMCRRLDEYFGGQRTEDWQAAEGEGGVEGGRGHVFLVGFVRSGTTLLEQVLASHPDVSALEEQATLRAITAGFFDDEAGLEQLRTLGRDEADRLRADYWRRVREFGVEPAGRLFVDKAPLSTLWLPVVAKLFPKAKVLLAIRDPRDVVLSSFRHRFLINGLTWPFTDLVETAQFYDGLMTLSDRYRAILPLDLYQHRHEDLVEDFDGEVGRICAFLGLEWTDSMRDFAETAKRRDVRTPSKDQVRRGLYREGMGRWRRYGPGVEPILPILEPWVKRYGYASDS